VKNQTGRLEMHMATPPSNAVSFLCQRVSLGTAVCPVANAIFLINGVTMSEKKRLARKSKRK